MPPATSDLEKREMTPEGCRQADGVWVRLEFLVGNCLLHGDLNVVSDMAEASIECTTYRIICGLDSKVWNTDSQNRVARRCVTVVGSLGRVTEANSSSLVSSLAVRSKTTSELTVPLYRIRRGR